MTNNRKMNRMQWVFIKNLYNFYRDLEQFNEKAVGVFVGLQMFIWQSAAVRRLTVGCPRDPREPDFGFMGGYMGLYGGS